MTKPNPLICPNWRDIQDSLSQHLAQADAVLLLLSTDGARLDGFTANHGAVMDAIWCAQTLVSKSLELLRQPLIQEDSQP